MSQLVQKLSQGEHPVEVSLRRERSLKAFRECIDRGFILLKFTGTRGGTELGIRLNKAACNINDELEKHAGKVRLVGDLMLDYQKVQCIAEIDTGSLSGIGWLVAN